MKSIRNLAALAVATMSLPAFAVPGTEGIFLDIDGAVFPGGTLTFTAEGATPGTFAVIVYGGAEQTGATCPAQSAPVCIDVRNYKLIGSPKRVPANGVVTWDITVPANLPAGAFAHFQVLNSGTSAQTASSNVVLKFNPSPNGGDLAFLLAGFYDIAAGAASASGFRLEEYYVERPTATDPLYLQWCRIAWDAVGTPTSNPCPQCDWAFDFNNTNATDASLTGDCIGYLGFDATTAGDFTESWGWSEAYYFAGYGDYETVFLTYDDDADPLTPEVWSWGLRSIVPYPIFYTNSGGAGGPFSWVYDGGVFAPGFY